MLSNDNNQERETDKMKQRKGWMWAIGGFAMAWMAFPVWAREATPTGLDRRVREMETTIAEKVGGDDWLTAIEFGGLIEVEAGHERIRFDDPEAETEKSGDVDLATVEFGIDARIAPHVAGRVLFLYEDDELTVDEGFVTLDGEEVFPGYLSAGKMYLPFGVYDSHFVSDPNTLTLGETNEGAAAIGFRVGEDLLDFSVGAFGARARKAGDDETIDSFVAAATFQPSDFLTLGASYISNLGGSDGFSEALTDPEGLDSRVGGWSAFVSLEILDRISLIGEIVGALDKFEAGEVYDEDDEKRRRPVAWNAELGVGVLDNLEIAVRYGGSEDGGADFLPETQYGAVVNWGFFDNTNLALEYMRGEFEDDFQETDTFTAQLAVEF
jgi:hypothetical protein